MLPIAVMIIPKNNLRELNAIKAKIAEIVQHTSLINNNIPEISRFPPPIRS